MFKKILSMLLVVIMLMTLLVSCNGKDNGEEPTTPPQNQTPNNPNNTPGGEDTYDITEILPESLNYGNTEFIVSVRNADRTKQDLGVEDDGSPLSQLLCERTMATEERLGVAISIDFHGSTDVNAAISDMRNKIQYQESVWDAIAGVSYRIPELASEGLFYNLYNFDYLDMTQEWWSQTLVKELTVNDRLFLATGDISAEYLDWCHAIFFNQTLAKAMGMDYSTFYKTVSEGKWTFNELYTLSKDAYADLNGNQKVDDGDQFGLLITSTIVAFPDFSYT